MSDEATPAPTVDDLLHHATRHTWVTPTLAVLLVGAFVFEIIRGVAFLDPTAEQLLKVGGGLGLVLPQGEWWRLLSATFLHAGIIHLVMNLWVLLQGGPLAERLFGNLGFLAIYFFSGIGASLLSAVLHPSIVSVGASGAIFGVFGALLAFMSTHRGVIPGELLRKQRNSILGFVAYNVLYGLAEPNIDLAGHAGGFIVGGIAGLLLSRDLLLPRAGARRRAAMAGLLALGLLAAGGVTRWRLNQNPAVISDRLASEAFAEYNAEHYQRSLELYSQALALQPKPFAPWLRERGRDEWLLKKPREALADWKAAIALDPTTELSLHMCSASDDLDKPNVEEIEAGVKYCSRAITLHPETALLLTARAKLYRAAKKLPEALADFDRSITLDPKDAWTYFLRSRVHQRMGNWQKALADLDQRDQLKPNDALTLNNRGWIKVLLSDFAGGRADADRSLALRPQDRYTLGTRCFALAGLGLRDQAHADCAQSVALCKSGDCHMDAGLLALLEKRPADARREWELAIKADPGVQRELEPWMAQAR